MPTTQALSPWACNRLLEQLPELRVLWTRSLPSSWRRCEILMPGRQPALIALRIYVQGLRVVALLRPG